MVRRPFDWESAGRELGEKLGEYNAVVVVGLDPATTGRVAIGVARAQAAHRRVAVGDLFAESPPIQELVHSDDPHGIVDSFLYGVSLTKIAYRVPEAGQLYVMPSGTEPPSYEEILPNPRWHRLAAGFREVGALLVLAAPATAPHIEKLVAATDGAVVIGEPMDSKIPVARVIASVREPRLHRTPTPGTGVARVTPAKPPLPPSMRFPSMRLPSSGVSRRRVAAFAGIGLTVLAAGVAAWLAYRPLAGSSRPSRHEPDCAKLAAAGTPCQPPARQATVAMTLDSARSDSSRDSSRAPVVVPSVPQVSNPNDSAAAMSFAVQLTAANTQAGAILKWQEDRKILPAPTFSPAVVDGIRWFKEVCGAFAKSESADSLLAALRQRKLLKPGTGNIVRLPFAFRIDSGVPATAVQAMVAAYGDHGQPVYALRQTDGTAWLLVGAYESPEQAIRPASGWPSPRLPSSPPAPPTAAPPNGPPTPTSSPVSSPTLAG